MVTSTVEQLVQGFREMIRLALEVKLSAHFWPSRIHCLLFDRFQPNASKLTTFEVTTLARCTHTLTPEVECSSLCHQSSQHYVLCAREAQRPTKKLLCTKNEYCANHVCVGAWSPEYTASYRCCLILEYYLKRAVQTSPSSS